MSIDIGLGKHRSGCKIDALAEHRRGSIPTFNRNACRPLIEGIGHFFRYVLRRLLCSQISDTNKAYWGFYHGVERIRKLLGVPAILAACEIKAVNRQKIHSCPIAISAAT